MDEKTYQTTSKATLEVRLIAREWVISVMRSALQEIADYAQYDPTDDEALWCIARARTALEQINLNG